MLDDHFIARDNLGFIKNFLQSAGKELPAYSEKLENASKKQLINYATWWKLLDDLEAQIKQPALGIEIGKHIRIEHCGLLGYLFQTSEDLNQALSCFMRFQRLLYGGSTASIEQEANGDLTLVWKLEMGLSRKISDELLLAGIVSVMGSVSGVPSFHPSKIVIPHALSESELAIYREFFQCEPHTNSSYLAISFHHSLFEIKLEGTDEKLHALLNQQASNLLEDAPADDTFVMELRSSIARSLHEGHPEAAHIATKLHISERTLHRKLKERHLLYRELLSDVRKNMAQTYLNDPKLTLAEIALMLSFQDQSAFSRAFRNWFGQSPRDFRLHRGKPVR